MYRPVQNKGAYLGCGDRVGFGILEILGATLVIYTKRMITLRSITEDNNENAASYNNYVNIDNNPFVLRNSHGYCYAAM